MLETTQNHLWKLLWEYDPNALIAVDTNLIIKVVNPAFCQLFQIENDNIIGKLATDILGEINHFKEAWEKNQVMRHKEREYSEYQIYVKEVIFPIKEENLIGCIMTDITEEVQRKKELDQMRDETVKKVNQVVHNQMKVAQEIAGLLGETTAESKVTLFKILKLINNEMI